MANIPFVEKYRPSNLQDIILDDVNRTVITNFLENKVYPNLLLYGPPGTGKTTTIINLISYIQKSEESNKSLLLHLNASDERGIDTIRNQIAKFIDSKPLFSKGTKFIVLDEVDYMTKNAQQALKYLLQQYNNKAVFCLMCNYISKIEYCLKNEFIELKFNKLPEPNIIKYMKDIATKENLHIPEDHYHQLQKLYKNDVRSMINYIQMNYTDTYANNVEMMNDEKLLEFFHYLQGNDKLLNKKNYTLDYCAIHNMTPIHVFIALFVLLIKLHKLCDTQLIKKFELVFHEHQYNIFEVDYIISLFSLIK